MVEIKVISKGAELEIILSKEESRAFMDLYNNLNRGNEVFDRTHIDDTYDILNEVWHKGWEVLNELGSEARNAYFYDN